MPLTNPFVRLWYELARNPTLSLQRRLFRAICLAAAITCFGVILPMNSQQQMPWIVNAGVVLFGLLSLVLFRESLRGRDHEVLLFALLVLLLDAIWFPNAGTNGSIPYYFFLAAAYPLALIRGKGRWFFVGGLFFNVATLILLEHAFPSLVVPFHSPAARLADLLTGLFSSMLGMALILGIVIASFDREHAAIVAVSKDLAASERKYREVVETASVVILRLDRQGRITFFNAHAEALFGWPRGEIVGREIARLFPATPEGGEGLARLEEFLRAPKAPVRFESENSGRDGRSLRIGWAVEPVADGEDAAAELLCVGTDITERRNLEEKRRQLEQQLLHVQRIESLGVLAGGIAHDFNNVLASMLGNIALVRMDVDPASEAHECLAEAEKAALHARDLTTQLLTFSRGGKPVTKTLSVAPLILDSLKLSLRGSHVASAVSIAPDLVPVDADPGQFAQVMNNLIINACQAMPTAGTVSVEAANVRLAENEVPLLPAGSYVRIAVKDEGTGIREEHLQRIFDPYFTTKQTGSGLGLAVVHSIVRNHRGQISVASTPGRGTTFTIHLPASGEAPADSPGAPSAPPVGNARVLVMDDEEFVRNVVGASLKRFGYEAEFARDGEEAIALYEKARSASRPFAAMLMDLTIPGGMGGKETIRRLLELDPSVRAVASSGYSNDPILADFRAWGFAAVLAKPYRPAELAAVLASVLREAGGAPASA